MQLFRIPSGHSARPSFAHQRRWQALASGWPLGCRPCAGQPRGLSGLGRGPLLVALALFSAPLSAYATPWLVSAPHARRLLAQGARLLDARPASAVARSHHPGAQRIDWRELSAKGPRALGGLLGTRAQIEAVARRLRLEQHRSVLVLGAARAGWGEEGRIVWALRSWGHPNAALVDGGWPALRSELQQTEALSPTKRAGRAPHAAPPSAPLFRPVRSRRWEASQAEVKRALASREVRLLDTREAREYTGQTPYGERRGGHLPGAVHLYYKELLDAQGKLLGRKQALAFLRAKGLDPGQPMITYCSGGVRSAFVLVLLHQLGFAKVRNYAGSLWQWSAAPAANYPLAR